MVVVFCCDGPLINNRFLEAISTHGTLGWFSAVARFRQHGFLCRIDLCLSMFCFKFVMQM